MSKIVDTRNIGSYTLSIYDDGAIIIEAAQLPEPDNVRCRAGSGITTMALTTDRTCCSRKFTMQPPCPLPAEPVESSEAIAQRVIE